MLATPAKAKLRLIIVGEGPDRRSEQHGRPFVGMSGGLLDQTLKKVGIDRAECYVTNATLCRPESDKETETAARCCAPRLLREISELPGVPAVALGKEAVRSLLGVTNIMLSRGFIWKMPDISERVGAQRARVRCALKKGRLTPLAELKLETLTLRNSLAGVTVFPTVHPAMVLRTDAWRAVLELDLRRVKRYLDGAFVDESELQLSPSVEDFVR